MPLRTPVVIVVNALRDQILSGSYKTGDWLPSERSLAEGFGVDRGVIRVAIQQLVQSGLIVRQPHCRPIIGPVPPVDASPDSTETEIAVVEAEPETPRQHSNFIALLMWHGDPTFEQAQTSQQRIFWGMNQALGQHGYHGVFLDLGDGVSIELENADREAMELRYILDHGFGGAIFYPYAYRHNRELVEEVSRQMPLVTIDRQVEWADTDHVGVDNYQAMFDLVSSLIDAGHRRIAYLTKIETIRAVHDRHRGYVDAITKADLEEIVLCMPSRLKQPKWAGVYAVFNLPKEERPTAAVVFNDYSAVALANRLETLGLSVPDDVAITGFDNIATQLSNGVGLTTVAQPYEEIGRKAVEVLLSRLHNPSLPKQYIELPAQLIVRESSSAPAP
ncbi:MAG: GntR family transcriptional regulator [Capsulimonas sp.]|uniref:GntR family transcriptional regulator n=1 Tax=Capsulimonas sp. TaxID=2494211 RepID=UPI0032673C62